MLSGKPSTQAPHPFLLGILLRLFLLLPLFLLDLKLLLKNSLQTTAPHDLHPGIHHRGGRLIGWHLMPNPHSIFILHTQLHQIEQSSTTHILEGFQTTFQGLSQTVKRLLPSSLLLFGFFLETSLSRDQA